MGFHRFLPSLIGFHWVLGISVIFTEFFFCVWKPWRNRWSRAVSSRGTTCTTSSRGAACWASTSACSSKRTTWCCARTKSPSSSACSRSALSPFLPCFTEFYRVWPSQTWIYLVWPGFAGFYWVLLGFLIIGFDFTGSVLDEASFGGTSQNETKKCKEMKTCTTRWLAKPQFHQFLCPLSSTRLCEMAPAKKKKVAGARRRFFFREKSTKKNKKKQNKNRFSHAPHPNRRSVTMQTSTGLWTTQ